LPPEPYEYADWRLATVSTDYHVEVLKQFYSVPYTYTRQKVDVRISHNMVEIFQNGVRLCSHRRLSGGSRQYSTCTEHMPENHKAYVEMNRENITSWAQGVGINTAELVNRIFGRVKVEQQAYRSCMGLKRIVKTYGAELTENACIIALQAREYGCGYVESLIKSSVLQKQRAPNIIKHSNIRGPEYYRGEVNNHA
jgi:hypothetical protein